MLQKGKKKSQVLCISHNYLINLINMLLKSQKMPHKSIKDYIKQVKVQLKVTLQRKLNNKHSYLKSILNPNKLREMLRLNNCYWKMLRDVKKRSILMKNNKLTQLLKRTERKQLSLRNHSNQCLTDSIRISKLWHSTTVYLKVEVSTLNISNLKTSAEIWASMMTSISLRG